MSFLFGGKKQEVPKEETPKEDTPRTAKRKKLVADRLQRAQERADRQHKLQSALQAQREADQALQDFLDIDPDILTGESISIS